VRPLLTALVLGVLNLGDCSGCRICLLGARTLHRRDRLRRADTWLPGWDGELGYGTYVRIVNAFENRSINSWARVAYILENGTWTCSFTSFSTLTGCADSDTRRRKAYCKNNDTQTYVGQCRVHS
jgi:hypothetical protein